MVQNSKRIPIWKKKPGKDRVLIQGQIKAGFILAREMVLLKNYHFFNELQSGYPDY
jgi:hypothetical protein